MNRKELFLFAFFTIFHALLYGQAGVPLTINREEQIRYIKQDTLPVAVYPLPPRVNTGFSEYNPVLTADSLFYFSSMRYEGTRDHDNFFEPYWFMRIFVSTLTMSGYSKPTPLPAIINSNKYFNANFSFNKAKNRIFFTRCKKVIDQNLECELWESTRENQKWKRPELMTRRINFPGSNTTQPFFVEYEDYAVLYFVSDRGKGFGGMDIWYAIWKNDRFSDPVNLGSLVNTPGDEISPFYDIATHTLYFSSNTHTGIGGYDIFYTKGALGDWSKPENMGVPFNSESHDIYFTVNQDGKTGYFSSNRPTQKSSPQDTCCYDIFTYRWLKDNENKDDTLIPDTAALVSIDAEELFRAALPITLYFDNDEPDPRSLETTTTLNYQSTLSDYIAKKEIYKTEYAKGISGEKKAEAELQMEHFFRDSVEKGFLNLEMITHYLLMELKKGNNVRISVSGYASALHKQEYNKRLTQRRISSFINYLREYGDGLFLPYLDGKSGNRLFIESDPRGSEEALRKNISDNIHDKKNAIYSIAASLERRITITEIEIKK